MRRKVGRKVISTVLTAALITSGFAFQTGDVSAAKKVKKLTLNKKNATLYKGADKAYSSITLKATVKPAKSAKVKFATSNNKVATVSSKGVVTAKKPGKVTITAKAGSKKTVCKITVKKITNKVKKVTVKKSNVTVYVGKTSKISASVTPKKVTLKKLTYKTSNKKVATVSASGVIKGVKAGKATITVAAVDGSKKKATIKVTVKKKAATPTTAPTTQPTTAPTTEPSTQPGVSTSPNPSATPSTQPAVSASPNPSATPSTQPAVSASPSPSTTPGPNNGGGSSGGYVPGKTETEVKPTIKDGAATYKIDTKDKSFRIEYGDQKASFSTADVETIMSYITLYADKTGTYNTAVSAYDKFKDNISTAENKTVSLTNLAAGEMKVQQTSTDTYHVTVNGKTNTTANGEYDVTAAVSGNDVQVETVDSNKKVVGRFTEIASDHVTVTGIKITRTGKEPIDLSSDTITFKLSSSNVEIIMPASDKLNNLHIYSK